MSLVAATVKISLHACYLVLFSRCVDLIYITQVDDTAPDKTLKSILAGDAEFSAILQTWVLLQGICKGQALLYPECGHGHRRTDAHLENWIRA